MKQAQTPGPGMDREQRTQGKTPNFQEEWGLPSHLSLPPAESHSLSQHLGPAPPPCTRRLLRHSLGCPRCAARPDGHRGNGKGGRGARRPLNSGVPFLTSFPGATLSRYHMTEPMANFPRLALKEQGKKAAVPSWV